MLTDALPQIVVTWINHYGSGALFVLLALGIVGLPIPDEALLVFAGYLVRHNHLNLTATLIAAIVGGIVGISFSYLLGATAGHFLVLRYGYLIGLTKERIDRVHAWFERIGKWLLLIGYYIPGVRHLTGYVAGTVELHYRDFALFAYTGAIIWALVFLSIGYFVKI